MDDFDKISERVHLSFAEDFLGLTMSLVEEVQPHIKSPIEAMLGAALLLGFNLPSGFNTLTPFLRLKPNGSEDMAATLFLTPQFKWKKYTVDFALYAADVPALPIFIECDGHDFHERTKEQAEHDRSRDRMMQEYAIPILRFTGREIHRSPQKCASSVLNFVQKHVNRFTA